VAADQNIKTQQQMQGTQQSNATSKWEIVPGHTSSMQALFAADHDHLRS
jgi:hypothetical protein